MAAAAADWGLELPEQETTPQAFLVWPENAEAVTMFSRLQTQWRIGQRGPVGLDYGAAQWLFSLCAVAKPLALLEDLQIMERTYLEELYS